MHSTTSTANNATTSSTGTDHGDDLDRLAELDTRIEQHLDRLVDVYAADPPEHLRMLGPYPTEPNGQQVWRYGATAIERYRIAHGVIDPDTPLGPQPRKPAALDAWRTAERRPPLGRPHPHTGVAGARSRTRGRPRTLSGRRVTGGP